MYLKEVYMLLLLGRRSQLWFCLVGIVLLKSPIFLLICQDILSITESGVPKFPTDIVELFISPLNSVNFIFCWISYWEGVLKFQAIIMYLSNSHFSFYQFLLHVFWSSTFRVIFLFLDNQPLYYHIVFLFRW